MSMIRLERRDKFTTVDRKLVNDKHLSFRARGLLVWMLDKPDGWMFESQRISVETTEGRDAIRAALAELEKVGYLARERTQDDHGRWRTEMVVRESPGRTDDGIPVVGEPVVGFPGDNTKTESKTEELETYPQPSAEDDEFAAFWASYPRRVEKKAARAAYAKARKTASAETIMAGLTTRASWWKESGTLLIHVPHPASWLNGERWTDDVEPMESKPTTKMQNPAVLAVTDEFMALIKPWLEKRWPAMDDNVRIAAQTALAQGYEFGETAVRLAIQFRIDRRQLAIGGTANFVLCNVANVSRFKGGVPSINGMERTYDALMDRAYNVGKWLLR